MWSDWLVVCDCGFSLSVLWCPLSAPTLFLGFLLPWTLGISSWLLQQSTAAAPNLGCGVAPLGYFCTVTDATPVPPVQPWALESITTNKVTGGDGIPVELFHILKFDAVKVLHSICQQIWKLSSGHRTGKGQFSFQSQRKAMPKHAQTTAKLHSSHTLVK